jgi:hypothetical protein
MLAIDPHLVKHAAALRFNVNAAWGVDVNIDATRTLNFMRHLA